MPSAFYKEFFSEEQRTAVAINLASVNQADDDAGVRDALLLHTRSTSDLKALEYLNLSNNNLPHLPASITQLQSPLASLTLLDLSRNALTTEALLSPTSAPLLGALTPNVKILRLHHNQLTSMHPLCIFPPTHTDSKEATIAAAATPVLENLEELWLSHNCIPADGEFLPAFRYITVCFLHSKLILFFLPVLLEL